MTTPRLAVLGYGRFGRAFADLALDAGLPVRAFDPAAEVPEALRAGSMQELLANADDVLLPVPIHALRGCLRQIRPFLRSDHLVIDVASVKLTPVAIMTEILGRELQWVATHPLFGPSALALGERPLRAVVCPNTRHPDAAGRARRMYERIGCSVIEQDADAHDRLMARSHALTFFVAKGMLDVDLGNRAAFGPPSVRAMASVIDAVRSDAGHLFLAIEKDNPYAAEARLRLLDALLQVHAQLEEADAASASSQEQFDIPDLGRQAPELRETRALIDDLDLEIVRLLERRARLALRAGLIKSEHGSGVRDAARERSLLEERRRWACELGLDEEAVAAVFKSIVRLSRAVQRADDRLVSPLEGGSR